MSRPKLAAVSCSVPRVSALSCSSLSPQPPCPLLPLPCAAAQHDNLACLSKSIPRAFVVSEEGDMIRRSPTVIAMCDTDVQQVRDAIAKRKNEALAARLASASGKPQTAPTAVPPAPAISSQPSQPFVAAEDAKRKREAMTREERLGLR